MKSFPIPESLTSWPVTPVSLSEQANIALYGRGVFTTVAVYDGEAIFWDKHWRRLATSSALLGIDILKHREWVVRDQVLTEIYKSGFVNGRVRVSFLDGSASEHWGGDGKGTGLSILVGERREVADSFKLTVSSFLVNATSPLAGIKSCNYLEPLMSYQEAKKRGFDEAIRLNE